VGGWYKKSAAERTEQAMKRRRQLSTFSEFHGGKAELTRDKEKEIYFLPFLALFCGPLKTRRRGQRLLESDTDAILRRERKRDR
jgi:hypothetical protein